ncbi:MAG: hypothetical protein NTV06_00440, partial [candidate division Zixibacteria bacterium]|nr:hypothetical protein [candidate division Zixibacteria bacterium]
MTKKVLLILTVGLMTISVAKAQETYFGRNKVQFGRFSWEYIQSRHFDVYYYANEYGTAKFAASVLESAYVVISDQLNYRIHTRIPIFIYNSPNDFQQTNIVPDLIEEGVGGFTEAFKNRIAIPFDGST